MREKGEETCPSTLVLVATLDEEEGIGPTLAEVNIFLNRPPCLVVDGRSADNTVKIAEAGGATVILQRDLGKGDAIATALDYLRRLDVKYVVLTDADYTYPAKYLPRMINILENNPKVGMVCGNRFDEHFYFGNIQNMYYLGNRLLAFTHNFFNGVNLHDPLTGLRAVRWEILRDWRPRSKSFDVEVELNHFVEKKGYGIMEIPIQYRQRLGEKKLKLRHGFTILSRILAEST